MTRLKRTIVATAVVSMLSADFAIASGNNKDGSDRLFLDIFNTEPCSNISRDWGTVIGGILGGVLGKKIGDKKTSAKIIGVMLGSILGNAIGRDLDRRRCELYKIAQEHQLDVEFEDVQLASDNDPGSAEENIFGIGLFTDPDALNSNYVYLASNDLVTADAGIPPLSSWHLAMSSQGSSAKRKPKGMISRWKGLQHFEIGSDKLTQQATLYFRKIADQYLVEKSVAAIVADARSGAEESGIAPQNVDMEAIRKQVENIHIVLVGNTDDTGDSEYNQRLSERRARSVAKVFQSRGVSIDRIYYRGAGETDPVADNATEEGRAKNRRVEIVEMPSSDELAGYIQLKKTRYEFYRPRPLAVSAETGASGYEAAASVLPPAATDERGSTPVQTAVSTSTQHSGDDASINAQKDATPSAKPNRKASDATPVRKEAAVPRIQTHAIREDESQRQKTEVADGRGGASLSKPSVQLPGSTSTANVNRHPPTGKAPYAETGVFDFGGHRASQSDAMRVVSSMGAAQGASGGFFRKFMPISEAVAAPSIAATPCYQDSPRVDGDYISLKTSEPLKHHTSEYAPGMYGTAWAANVNGHLVGIAPIRVLRSNMKVVENPKVYVYRDQSSPDLNKKASVQLDTQVNAYPGEKGLLFRVFAKGKNKSFVCQDVVLPTEGGFAAKDGNLYFIKDGQLHAASFVPEMLNTK